MPKIGQKFTSTNHATRCMVVLGASTCCHWTEWFFYLVQREMVYLIDLILASAMINMWIIGSLNKTRQDIYHRNINEFLVTQLAKTLVMACQINECRRLQHLSPHNEWKAKRKEKKENVCWRQKQEEQICVMQVVKKLEFRISRFYFSRYHGGLHQGNHLYLLIFQRAHWLIFV